MNDPTDRWLDAITALLPPLLAGLEGLAHAGRHLHPPELPVLVARLAEFRQPLTDGLRRFEAEDWPEHLTPFATQMRAAAACTLEGLERLTAAPARSDPLRAAYRAVGCHARAAEALYPVAFMLPPVNRFFLDPAGRHDEGLQARLLQADPGRDDTGVMHADNAAEQRGGWSLYVPEYHQTASLPLVVALHGGSGHGRSFLWTWLADARSRGAIVIAPTARGDTWSISSPDVDTPAILAMVEHVRSTWAVDAGRILLTGMSDGGTFTYLAGLQDDSPFTHLAPISAAFHPMLVDVAAGERLKGLPIYLVHGALDWMFPAAMAQLAHTTLRAAGAAVVYEELPDLSHTYPREQNARILEWLLR
jgi:phospholipase/carboxylesterase